MSALEPSPASPYRPLALRAWSLSSSRYSQFLLRTIFRAVSFLASKSPLQAPSPSSPPPSSRFRSFLVFLHQTPAHKALPPDNRQNTNQISAPAYYQNYYSLYHLVRLFYPIFYPHYIQSFRSLLLFHPYYNLKDLLSASPPHQHPPQANLPY